MIREMTERDSLRILEIYKMGLDTRNATFETSVPSWTDWDLKHLKHSRFIYTDNKKILGWTALSPVSNRIVYKGVAEINIYVDTSFLGKGIGSLLIDKAIVSSEKQGTWTLYSCVFPENIATLRLHEKFGFTTIRIKRKDC